VEQYGTDPTKMDTDGDGETDGAEVENGSDPTGDGSSSVRPLAPGQRPLVVAAVLVGVSIVVGTAIVRRRGRRPWATRSDDDPDQADADTDVREGDDGTTAATAATVATSDAPPDALSDADRVRDLLDDRGGRIRQSTIVEETGWSKSKVSRLLSRMADEGDVEKITLGRENLIVHPDEVPSGAESPFEADDTE
jgi:hypothetical protein